MSADEPSLIDHIAGKLKRAAGELGGRPDLVLEGEAQDTGCAREGSGENSDPEQLKDAEDTRPA